MKRLLSVLMLVLLGSNLYAGVKLKVLERNVKVDTQADVYFKDYCIDGYRYRFIYQGNRLISAQQVLHASDDVNFETPKSGYPVSCK